MKVANWIFANPGFYWSLALVLSAYYGFRGCVFQTVGMLTCFRFFGQWILLFWTARGELSDVESQVAEVP